jgi:hypothetical protein
VQRRMLDVQAQTTEEFPNIAIYHQYSASL